MSLLGLLAIAVGVVAAFTAAATAVRSVSRIWLRHWVERRLSGAPSAQLYLERPQQLIMAATTGVALTVVGAGMIIGTRYEGGPLAITRVVALFALSLLAFGQLVPRAIARRWPNLLIPPLLPVLQMIDVALTPLLLLARRLSGETARDVRDAKTHDEDTLGDLLREGELEGVGEHTEIAIIEGVVQFGDKTVGQVMTRREDIYAVDESLDPVALAQRLVQGGYSRVPVMRGSLDTIVGFVHARDVLDTGDGERPALRPIGVASPSLSCNDMLFRMLRERKHLGIVVDGARTVGLVTLEDLLEELVGDIRDEHDEPTPA